VLQVGVVRIPVADVGAGEPTGRRAAARRARREDVFAMSRLAPPVRIILLVQVGDVDFQWGLLGFAWHDAPLVSVPKDNQRCKCGAGQARWRLFEPAGLRRQLTFPARAVLPTIKPCPSTPSSAPTVPSRAACRTMRPGRSRSRWPTPSPTRSR